jgi:hypothetical protein
MLRDGSTALMHDTLVDALAGTAPSLGARWCDSAKGVAFD